MTVKSQDSDSTWFVTKYLPRYYVDTATYLPNTKFVDTNNQEKVLTDYKGKILYVDVWATWCGNCLIKFPYQEQLLKRLKIIHLDTLIQFINISIENSEKEWYEAMKKYHPIGINLYCSDTALLTKWNIEALPAYSLLDSSGKVLGKDICEPDDGATDYILYAATKGIHPVQAFWKQYGQSKLLQKYQTLNAFTDKDYANWFSMTMESFLEFQKWRQQYHQQIEQEHKNSLKHK